MGRKLKIVHLPCYYDNPYQGLLMDAQTRLGHETIDGGGGGNFFRTIAFKKKPDIVHFHWIHPYLLREGIFRSLTRATRFIVEVLLLKGLGIKLVWTIHNLHNHDNRHLRIERFFSCLFARICDVRIAHTIDAARKAEHQFLLGKGDVNIIPHMSYFGLYPAQETSGSARKSLKLSQDSKVFLFLGRINEYKGIFDLINCLPQDVDDLTLLVAGEPADENTRNKLHKAVGNDSRIQLFPHRIPDEELQLFFGAADVVVFPYRDILTSGAVILAMSFGKFVIVPDLPVMQETVADGGGLFFTPGNMDSLKGALHEALGSNDKTGGAENLKRARKWEVDKIAEMTISSYLDQ